MEGDSAGSATRSSRRTEIDGTPVKSYAVQKGLAAGTCRQPSPGGGGV